MNGKLGSIGLSSCSNQYAGPKPPGMGWSTLLVQAQTGKYHSVFIDLVEVKNHGLSFPPDVHCFPVKQCLLLYYLKYWFPGVSFVYFNQIIWPSGLVRCPSIVVFMWHIYLQFTSNINKLSPLECSLLRQFL